MAFYMLRLVFLLDRVPELSSHTVHCWHEARGSRQPDASKTRAFAGLHPQCQVLLGSSAGNLSFPPSCHTHPCSAKVRHVDILPCIFLQCNSGGVSGSTDEFCLVLVLVHDSVLWLLLLLQVGFVVGCTVLVRDVSKPGLGVSRKLFPFFLFLSPCLLISSGKKSAFCSKGKK